jgi:hypothetical protein
MLSQFPSECLTFPARMPHCQIKESAMSESDSPIRPRAHYLKQLTALARRSPEEAQLPGEPAVVQELKLQTPTARYWLCTEGLAQPQPGVPKAWAVGYITPEYLLEDGTWCFEENEAYGPQSTPWLQGNDYLQMLTDEYERLKRQSEEQEETNWRLNQQMEVTQDEMRQVIAQLDAIVQQKQGQKV